MPAYELRGSVSKGVRTRRHGLMTEIAPQILPEQLDGAIALRGLALESFRHDVVQIAAQRALVADVTGQLGGARRILIQRQAGELGRRFFLRIMGMPADQQHEQYETECVDVRGGSYRRIQELLRGGVRGGQGRTPFSRERRLALPQQCRDTEVQELHHTFPGHEDIGGLQVTMDDQMAMCMRDCGENIEKQSNTAFQVNPMTLDIGINALTVDVFEYQVRLAARGNTGIGQVRDIRVTQLREHRAFLDEALFGRPSQERGVQQLYGGPSLEAAVATMRQPYGSHSAVT